MINKVIMLVLQILREKIQIEFFMELYNIDLD